MLGAAAAVTVALGLAPFLLADGADTLFSLVTFRGALPVGGGSIWELTVGTRFEGWAQHLDSAAVIAVALIAAGGVRWRVRRRAPDRRTAYGILALVALCFPLLVKTVWPYYFLDCYVLAAVWSLGAPGGPGPRATALRVLLPAAISGCALLAELGVDAGSGPGLRRAESAAMFVILTAIALGLARALTRDYGTAVGIGGGVGAAGVVGAAEAAGTLGTGTPEGSGAPDGGGDTGADVGPSGGVGQLARATLKGVDDGLGEGEVPAGGVT
jgi:hypothetical protein